VTREPLLQRTRPIDDARQAVGEHAERGGDTGQQEHRCNRRLDQTRNIHGL